MLRIQFRTASHNREIAVTDPPYELLGDFLTVEAPKITSWPVVKLPAEIVRVRRDKSSFLYSGDAYIINLMPDAAVLMFAAIDPADECRIPLDEFEAALLDWKRHLEGLGSDFASIPTFRPLNGGRSRIAKGVFRGFSGETLTSAGEYPYKDQIWYGTEDGKLLIPPNVFQLGDYNVTGRIRAAAFTPDFMGISTNMHTLMFRISSDGSEPELIDTSPPGSFDIVATSEGHFIASLGREGLAFYRKEGRTLVRKISGIGNGENVDFSRIHSLQGKTANESILFCAARQNGICAIICQWKTGRCSIVRHPFRNLDIVDVYSLNAVQFPFAAIALAEDTTVLFSRDVRSERPTAIKMPLTGGKGRRIFSRAGAVFIVSDGAMTVLPDLATRFLSGTPLDSPTPLSVMPITATFANVVYDHHILLGTPDKVFTIKIDDILPSPSSPHGDPQDAEHGEGNDAEFLSMDLELWNPEREQSVHSEFAMP